MAFVKGQSGNPSGRPKAVKELKELALKASPKAWKRILELTESDNPKVALAAAQEVLNRAYGKPTQSVEMSGKDGAPLVPVLNVTLSRSEG